MMMSMKREYLCPPTCISLFRPKSQCYVPYCIMAMHLLQYHSALDIDWHKMALFRIHFMISFQTFSILLLLLHNLVARNHFWPILLVIRLTQIMGIHIYAARTFWQDKKTQNTHTQVTTWWKNNRIYILLSTGSLAVGPSGRLLALWACLTLSFTPFRRSSRVTHAPIYHRLTP